jgi:hypothetical protein
MRKQARRLWLGDWHRDDEPAAVAPDPDQDEIVLLTPDDGDPPPAEPGRNVRRGVAAAAAIAVLCALGIALLSGGGSNDKPVAADTAQSPPAQAPQTQAVPVPQAPQGPQQGFGAPDLTGAAATKAAQAAVARFPGNVERVTRGPTGGGYVVHVIQADGNEVHVLVDPHFKVRGSDAGSAPQGFGPGTSQ